MSQPQKILSSEQQDILSEEKIDYKIEREIYLRSHPELSDLIRCLFQELVVKKPATKADILRFICDFFQQSDLQYKVMLYAKQRESDLTDYEQMMAGE
ncbi:uncharacterized protein MONOS_17475 [Monocercomonoides exilis]|uniref:uncharacterized protein n=1 Tax=Monocercomonoides exilis TaxID=2049356 RepID=UPI0035594D84|nr:hypothetical protein MONOS_17475 [Monocercomonoides exilis]